jgi:thiamine biosynthesis lipoprotein
MIATLLGAWLGLLDPGWTASKPATAGILSRFEFVETHMGCTFKIVLYSTDEAAARDASRRAFDRIASLDAILSDYQPESELSRLGQKAGGPPVPVSPDLFDVLSESRRWYEKTGGVLDVTIAPVGRLWRRARRERKLPDPRKLAEARTLIGSDKLVLDPVRRTVRLALPGMRLDVGGIAKGYASQAALEVLRAQGVTRALVGGAGDIVVGDPPPDAPGWTIGIAGLNPEASPPETYVLLKNQAISTSGDAERFVIIDGHRYSHIINPVTGMAVEDRASVTVIAPDGATADALETSVYLLGPERGLKLIEETEGTAAIYVRATPEGIRTFESSRFKAIPRTRPKDDQRVLKSPERVPA